MPGITSSPHPNIRACARLPACDRRRYAARSFLRIFRSRSGDRMVSQPVVSPMARSQTCLGSAMPWSAASNSCRARHTKSAVRWPTAIVWCWKSPGRPHSPFRCRPFLLEERCGPTSPCSWISATAKSSPSAITTASNRGESPTSRNAAASRRRSPSACRGPSGRRVPPRS